MLSNQVIISAIICIIIIAVVLLVFYFSKLKQGTDKQEKTTQNEQVYIGNLSYRVRERNLREHFSRYGDVSEVKIVKNRSTGRSKGFGFISFSSIKYANKALSSNGELFHGRTLVVRIAKPR